MTNPTSSSIISPTFLKLNKFTVCLKCRLTAILTGVAAARDDDDRLVVLAAGAGRLGVAGSSASSVEVSRIVVSANAEEKIVRKVDMFNF